MSSHSVDQRASVSAFAACVAGALALCGLLVFENGRMGDEYLRVSDVAENAARLAAQNIVGIREGNPRIDQGSARSSALSYMALERVRGSVEVTGDGKVLVRAVVRVQVQSLTDLFGLSRTISVVRTARSVDG